MLNEKVLKEFFNIIVAFSFAFFLQTIWEINSINFIYKSLITFIVAIFCYVIYYAISCFDFKNEREEVNHIKVFLGLFFLIDFILLFFSVSGYYEQIYHNFSLSNIYFLITLDLLLPLPILWIVITERVPLLTKITKLLKPSST